MFTCAMTCTREVTSQENSVAQSEETNECPGRKEQSDGGREGGFALFFCVPLLRRVVLFVSLSRADLLSFLILLDLFGVSLVVWLLVTLGGRWVDLWLWR